MSQNLENLFKESLQNLDAPYNPQAWEALQSRLDAAMPVAAPKKPFNIWKASAIVVGVVGISTAIYFLASSPIKEDQKSETKVATKNTTIENQTNETTSKEAIVNEIEQSETVGNSNQTATQPILKTASPAVSTAQPTPSKKVDNPAQNQSIGDLPTQDVPTINKKTPEISSNDNLTSISIPTISKQCQNEKVKISNTNSHNLIVTFPSGKKETIGSKKQATINLTEGGVYTISDSYSEKEKTFIVNATNEPDFEVDQTNIYKGGLPSTVVNTSFIANDYKWSCDKSKVILSGKENEFHFFKEGQHTIELEITDQNGCKCSTSKVVNIANDYNLMAVDAFNPLHNDLRRNTFMPFALKQRNTGFTLIIIDPKDGGVVYQTNDASAGWDGIDKRSGNLAVNGANYIWKVTLANPVAGENENYKGVVLVTR